LELYRRVNVGLTLRLARQAAECGVRRFIFISTVKVIGEATPFGQPFSVDSAPHPMDPYGQSKLEAENALLQLGQETGMEIVIIRPVLVYGPGVKANFNEMIQWVSKGIPLPFGALANRRSLVAIDNLVDLIAVCLQHPAAKNQIFLVSDGEDLTITALLTRTAAALNRPTRLLPVPVFVLSLVGRMLGKKAVIDRLCDSLQVDITKTKALLGWEPVATVDEALNKVAQEFRRG
jgi:UDP-glucose 4-epimerase